MLTVRGGFDDGDPIVDVEGDVGGWWRLLDNTEDAIVACSDGTLLLAVYLDGEWTIDVARQGACRAVVSPAGDEVVLSGTRVEWVTYGIGAATTAGRL